MKEAYFIKVSNNLDCILYDLVIRRSKLQDLANLWSCELKRS